ncbi:nucleotidyltransferase [Paenibacillus sp. 1P07SE]|uniref:nucleotidyltransferase n=1 Tax=Paenibacillus sp. 1P07SE TaxID=3132209 RepID=UPI0039A5CCA9
MRTVGLIVEYNPFHNGHLYHMQQSVKQTGAEAVVAVMSGHFLQRGEPALLDKWARTEMALAGGCDLVIELPIAYAAQPAEWFAYGAVSLLEATGVVDALCFGSESGDLERLARSARLLADEPPRFKELLHAVLGQGSSYPAAYAAAADAYLREQGTPETALPDLASPNNSLGLHYLMALERISSPIRPYTVLRQKAGYHQEDITDSRIASATAIRQLLASGGALRDIAPYVPASTLTILEREWHAGRAPVSWESFVPQLLHLLASSSAERLSSLHGMSEGLQYRLLRALPQLQAADFEQLLALVKTRRYTRTKLQRVLLAVLLGHSRDELKPARLGTGIQYIRVLGFTGTGQKLLARMRKQARLPVLLSAARPPADLPYLELDVRASAVYAVAQRPPSGSAMYRDYLLPPIRI